MKTNHSETDMSETYDFDRLIDRRGTGALKVDDLAARYGRQDLIPMWVADMDFETPHFITKALTDRMQHSLFGYTVKPEAYWRAIVEWVASHHGWQVEREWLSYIPGIVKGIGMVVNVFTQPEDKVIIMTPVYHPFRLTPEGNGRQVVACPLKVLADGSCDVDFEALDKVADERCKLLIMANPHNPIGITWKRQTLVRLADFCHGRGIIVVSDEIHCDLTLFGNRHIPFASVSPQAAACSITFGAPTKTFNIAGIVSSYSIVPDPALRQRFYSWLDANEFGEPSLFAPIATMAAFSAEGEEWRRQLVSYLEGNVLFVEHFCREHLPQVVPVRPQASYLVWLDCRGLGLRQEALNDLFVNGARLALIDGTVFGQEGQGFMRLNVGCPRATLSEAMQRLKAAVQAL